MIKASNLSYMTIEGWQTRYSDILKEFGYSKSKDLKSAKLLSSFLKRTGSMKNLRQKIKRQTVFVIGAGPSLSSSIPILKKYNKITKIVADGASKALVENKIRPDIVVSDLDGDMKTLRKIGKGNSIIVTHAHGDNFDKLKLVLEFKNCIGTTETKPFGKLYNFGGFTDGDRCVFLAHHFMAKKIILFGMDFGTKIGKYSKTKISDKKTKIKKLRRAKKLLEWLASKNCSGLYTTSKPISGFKKICYKDLDNIISEENAF